MNEKEMLMKQLRANAFPHNNGKVMQAINIIRHSYNRLTDVQQAAQIWGVSQDDFLDCINYLAQSTSSCARLRTKSLFPTLQTSAGICWKPNSPPRESAFCVTKPRTK